MRLFARAGVAVVAAGVMAVAAAGPASAHFCFKTNRNATSTAAIAGSNNWISFADIAREEIPGVCDAAIAYIAEAAGASADTMINGHGTMAGGTLRKGAGSGTSSISHLDFEALEAAIPAGMALCGDGGDV
ncbi:MAG: hypothetical protein ACRDV1_07625 [Actinomycetes bacterium]